MGRSGDVCCAGVKLYYSRGRNTASFFVNSARESNHLWLLIFTHQHWTIIVFHLVPLILGVLRLLPIVKSGWPNKEICYQTVLRPLNVTSSIHCLYIKLPKEEKLHHLLTL